MLPAVADTTFLDYSPDDLERAIDEELNAILDETVEAFSSGELSAPDAESSQFARLAELQEREIVAAMASLNCGVAEGRQLLKEAIAELAERGG
jgi:hypothetical protein